VTAIRVICVIDALSYSTGASAVVCLPLHRSLLLALAGVGAVAASVASVLILVLNAPVLIAAAQESAS
jgi:hypothetical protein